MIEDMTMRGFKEDTRRDYVRHVRATGWHCLSRAGRDLRRSRAAVRRPRLEVADLFHRHGADWRRANAGHAERCEDCGHSGIAYNSCRNRHCPKCQGAAAQVLHVLPKGIHGIRHYGLLASASCKANIARQAVDVY